MFYVPAKQKKSSRATKDTRIANQNYGNYGEITALRRHNGIMELRILKTEVRNSYGYGEQL